MTKQGFKSRATTLGLLIIVAAFLAGLTGCIVVRDRSSSRPAAVHKHKHAKHQHRHCHTKRHKKQKVHKAQCHNHPHGHPHH